MQKGISECNQMMKQTLTSSSFKDSDWLMIEVCREHQRNKCKRGADVCRYAHPSANVDVQGGRVVCCYDFIKDRCKRFDPQCKYFHPPQHLRDQLIQNGRNNLILRKIRMPPFSQHLIQMKPSANSMTVNSMLNGYQTTVPTGNVLVPGVNCLWSQVPSRLGGNMALWPAPEMAANGAASCYSRVLPVATDSTPPMPEPQWMNIANRSIRPEHSEINRSPAELHHSTSFSSAFHNQTCAPFPATGVEYNGTVYYPPAFVQLPKQAVKPNGDRRSAGDCQMEFTSQQVAPPQRFPIIQYHPNFIMQGY